MAHYIGLNVRPNDIDVLHVGPQKSGTTWLFQCLREHSDVALPRHHMLNFFDMHYHRGLVWLDHQFADSAGRHVRVDVTPSYLRDPLAPLRAHAINPDAKIILCLRDPVARAFSHYWHEKKKKRFNFKFHECLENYDLFCNWIEPGFYATHLKRWMGLFGPDHVLCQEFDILERDPHRFLAEALSFIGVNANFTPSVIGTKVNPAGRSQSRGLRAARKLLVGAGLEALAKKSLAALRNLRGGREIGLERISDVRPEVIAELRRIFETEVTELEELLGRPLPALRGDGCDQ